MVMKGNPKHAGREPNPKPPTDKLPGGRGGNLVAVGTVETKLGWQPLMPGLAGEVVEVCVQEGDAVAKGKPLLRLDPRQAESSVRSAEAGIKAATGKLTEAENGVRAWELSCQAYKKEIESLVSKKNSADIKLQQAKDALALKQTSQATVDAASAELDGFKKGIEALQLKLKALEEAKPETLVQQAKAALEDAKSKLDLARLGVEKCTLVAPSDGTVEGVLAHVGDKYGPNVALPAFRFRPKSEMIVRAEIDQEWVTRVHLEQPAVIQDAANSGRAWRGKVTYIAKVFQPKRDGATMPNLFQQPAENVLECRITLDPGQTPQPFIGQKVRVHLSSPEK
jgi:multidrug resistance efflux pump